MKRKFMNLVILACVLLGGLGIGSALAAPHATTITVNTTNDELNSDGDCSLREAVRAANLDAAVSGCPAGSGDDTIVLQSSATYTLSIVGQGEDAAATGDLDFTDTATTITGNNATIQAGTTTSNGIDRVIHILNGKFVSISNVTVRHSAIDGAIWAVGRLNLSNSTVTLNNVRAINISQTSVSDLSNVTVSNNMGSNGGGILVQGVLTISNSSIAGNNSDYTAGGIAIDSNALVTISDSVISGNNADADNNDSGEGGGIWNRGTLTLSNSTVSDNDAADGGGIYNDGGTVTIIQSALTGNTAISAAGIRTQNDGTLNIVNSTLSGNVASPGGAGGIANSSGTVNLSNVTIASNTAASGTGGGINTLGTVNMKNSIVANNSASTEPDCKGTIVSGGYNLIENTSGCTITGTTTGNKTAQDPNLAALALNNGTTKTHALNVGSPAIDAGNLGGCTDHNSAALTGDQRNFVRHVDGDGNASAICDMGSFERLASGTLTHTPTRTKTPTKTKTPTNTPSPTNTRTNTPTRTQTLTPTQTRTPTQTLTPTKTLTPTQTRTPTQTLTPTQTPTSTNTPAGNLLALGYVWNDLDFDGIRETGEPFLQNITVEMTSGDKSILYETDVTDANGRFDVHGPGGSLRVHVILPSGFTFSPKGQGSGLTDSDIFPIGADGGYSEVISQATGGIGIDAGMYTGATPTPTQTQTPTRTQTPTQTPVQSATPTVTATATTGCTVTQAPTLLKPKHKATTTKTRVKLVWESVTCAESYNVVVYLKKVGGTVVDAPTNLTVLNYKTIALQKGKTYAWQVQGCVANVCGPFSTARKFTIAP